jgi:predicted nucleotidyltransferase
VIEITADERIAEHNRFMLLRHEHFRLAARYVADGLAACPAVEKVVLFGSVAKPLAREISRRRSLRHHDATVWHECKDIDLAVWVDDLSCLRALQRARSQGVNNLLREHQIGVAHHQVDVFIMEPGSDRYLSRFLDYGNSADPCICIEELRPGECLASSALR